MFAVRVPARFLNIYDDLEYTFKNYLQLISSRLSYDVFFSVGAYKVVVEHTAVVGIVVVERTVVEHIVVVDTDYTLVEVVLLLLP
mmetsp:Transcript_1621/g.2476  ORF Transcript_1621/g.2476 Transcript_1621/m.2476 type:complete len:85 (+) Transcript_1621:1155-1409(+)